MLNSLSQCEVFECIKRDWPITRFQTNGIPEEIAKRRVHSHDTRRCFNETRNNQLNVIVACSWFPRNIFGRFHALCAYIRFILLAFYVVYMVSKSKQYDLFLCDQISACIPILRRTQKPILFYCHYPDQLLTKRESLIKKLYRWSIDRRASCRL